MDIKCQNVPAPGEEYVMECKLSVEMEVEQPDGEVIRVWEQPVINPIPHKKKEWSINDRTRERSRRSS